MDPISVGLLAALAGGAGGEAGRQVWAGLSALVRRPFQRVEYGAQTPAVSSGEAEVAALGQAPADPARAQALSTALAVRAAVDSDFHASLQEWYGQAKLVRTGDGDVNNTISGGTQNGPVLQGRDFSRISFTTPPPPSSSLGDGTPPTRG
ncbi:hypothetical protein [Streptomyces olivochromogenes]|uniref:Uncharacterized protein n=1 Tax=Streptomyces olivochromogenes TaxID=1963 RepID=A0A250VV41_STROL|nr:hypothetical protein [Streptomyces olivochromogenes]KUN35888.1 hypothetical protein AQJ27_47985 [Streptomyces olivochromogenes]GAX57892.1 hypothetical protein SO3561_09463 [Streptomyces olivochromogenes]